MPHLPETRHSLLARLAQSGDTAAWTEFLNIYEEAVLRYCHSRGLQEADARDVVQEVLLAVHRVMGNWEPSGRGGSFRAWLVQTAHRQCLKLLRKQTRCDRSVGGSGVQRDMQDLPATDSVEDDEAEFQWQRFAFCWAAAQIQREVQQPTWQAFWLTAVNGQSPSEVANQLGMQVGSVYAAKCRVLSRIRERVQELSRSER
jgi:RNA polymerase sigma-70 factor (ECF subfamily)